MSRFPPHAAAVLHLGLRRAGQRVSYRARRHTGNLALDTALDLGLARRAAGPFLVHANREKAAYA
jgi:hypothetical protein